MRISVQCGGFTGAADACRTANQTSAVLTESLGRSLGGHAGMAGNDATSLSFGGAYDESAREGLAAMADLTHAFIGAGRLLADTGSEHASAEAAAADMAVSDYVGAALGDDFVRVQPASPPPSVGAQEASLSKIDAWILDQVEGFFWPSADVGELRAAGASWRRAATTTAVLADHMDAALTFLQPQRSPEVPLAVDALTDLSTLIGDTAWQLSSVATACEDYADAVEEARERTRALLSEIAQMVVEGAAFSVLITGVTGGLGGGVAAGAAIARVQARAPRFYALLVTLRAGVTAAGARLERVTDDLATIRIKVERFLRVPARGERGSLKQPGGWMGPHAFEPSPKHPGRSVGRASRGPHHGQRALDESVTVNASTTTRRIAYDAEAEEFVVFDETVDGVFHGHVRSWGELTHAMQRSLIDFGVVDRKGRAVTKGGT